MKRLIITLFAVIPFAVLAVATSASSAFEFLCGGQAILTSGNCKANSINLEALLLNDMGVPATIECPAESVTSTGSVLSSMEAETATVTFAETGKKCKPSAKAENLKSEEAANGCEAVVEITAVHLPWKITLEEEESGLWWGLFLKSKPGYKTTCKTILGNVSDECVASEEAARSPLLLFENLTEEETGKILLLDVFFTKELLAAGEAADCTLGGKENGLVIGEQLLTGEIGGKVASLEIS